MFEKLTPVLAIRRSSAIATRSALVITVTLRMVRSENHRNCSADAVFSVIPITGNNPKHWADIMIGCMIEWNVSLWLLPLVLVLEVILLYSNISSYGFVC